ncbi:MAG: hypothetical protein AVDCRST_MAG10-3702, partial [uncultured Acidimicrobiales bacterium]
DFAPPGRALRHRRHPARHQLLPRRVLVVRAPRGRRGHSDGPHPPPDRHGLGPAPHRAAGRGARGPQRAPLQVLQALQEGSPRVPEGRRPPERGRQARRAGRAGHVVEGGGSRPAPRSPGPGGGRDRRDRPRRHGRFQQAGAGHLRRRARTTRAGARADHGGRRHPLGHRGRGQVRSRRGRRPHRRVNPPGSHRRRRGGRLRGRGRPAGQPRRQPAVPPPRV